MWVSFSEYLYSVVRNHMGFLRTFYYDFANSEFEDVEYQLYQLHSILHGHIQNNSTLWPCTVIYLYYILYIKPDNPAQHEPIKIPSSLNEKASIVYIQTKNFLQ
jgi:hypothetical protein